MTAATDPTEQAPGKPLSAPLPASTPEVGTRGGLEGEFVPQAGAQVLDPDRLAAALAEVLARLYALTRVDGSVIGWQTVTPIRPALYDRWQAALQPDASEPGE